MRQLAVVLSLAACSKAHEPSPQPRPAVTAATTPTVAAAPASSNAPGAGTTEAPASSPLAQDSPMWNAAIKTLQGQPATLAAHKGKALLLVNVASRCGMTPQYAQLEQLQDQYGPKGFTVVGFPCNQFGGQEPGTAEEIAEFCSATYGVSFPMMEKIEVNGPGRHPIYQELTRQSDASGYTGDIRWNFEKFVVSADGARVARFSPKTRPDDPTVIAAIEAALPR